MAKTTIDRVRKTINAQQMLREDDRIAVAISGGKDSAVLLDVLHKIERRYPHAELMPLTIDEGISGYRDKALQAARKLSFSLNLNLEVYSFKDLFGDTLDEIIELRGEDALGACSYCGVLRRTALNIAAKDLNADVITTGHNLDDESQTILMNILRGESIRIARTSRRREDTIEGFVPRVKPLTEISERDIVAYSYHLMLPYHDVPCPYAGEAYRNDVRDFLNKMEYERPGTLLAVLRSGEAIADMVPQKRGSIEFCECIECGEPTPSGLCKGCQMLREIRGE
jgi:uncharacterized protein (TIGR00269 family)